MLSFKKLLNFMLNGVFPSITMLFAFLREIATF